ncbi:hypothetical protein B566_EDAN008848 [Ephemera danica]|nr:hypothetical protein B566_EDAN008848 [Ephemera danica]
MAKMTAMLLKLLSLFFFLKCSFVIVTANSNLENNQKIFQKVLEHLNEENNSKYRYESAEMVETHILDGVVHFIADVTTGCLEDASGDNPCFPLSLICQGKLENDALSLVKCFVKEDTDPALPSYNHGFVTKRSNKFIENILTHSLNKLTRDDGKQRQISDIVSVKKRETSGTEVFITANIVVGSEEAGDMLEMEMCEVAAVMGTPGQILDSESKCFPLMSSNFEVDHLGSGMVTTEQLTSLASWSLDKINTSTPGSGGVLTTMQIRLAPSLCPKHSADLDTQWRCAPSGQPIICTVSTWERPWRGDTLMSRPKCKRFSPPPNPIRVARHTGTLEEQRPGFCTGCLVEMNKETSEVAALVAETLEKLNTGSFVRSPRPLIRVISVHSQVVNGVRYELNLELGGCEGDTCETGDVGSVQCHVELIENYSTREKTAADSPKLKTSPLTEGVAQTQQAEESTPVSQAEGQPEQAEQIEYAEPHSTERRSRRSTKSLGAQETVDLEKEGTLLKELAQLALDNIDDIDDDRMRRKLLEIVGAKKQVVNGYTYQLTLRVGVMPPCEDGTQCYEGDLPSLLCQVWVHRSAATRTEQPQTRVMRSSCMPEDLTDVQEAPERPSSTSTQNFTEQHPSVVHRTKRSTPGGRNPANVNDPYIQEMAQFAVSELDKSSGSPNSRLLVRIVSAETQVVAGKLTHLTLELGQSDCLKGSTGPCSLSANGERGHCTVSVWDRPWLKKRVIEDFSCTPVSSSSRGKRDTLLGGRHAANIADPYIQEVSQFALSELDHSSNSLYTRQVVRIVSAETQVVAGTLIHLTLELAYSNCSKGAETNVNCSLQDNLDRERCTLSVWDRPWLKKRHLQNPSCTTISNSKRQKRSTRLLGRGNHDIHYGMFREFMVKHGKSYASRTEERRRFHIFRANLRKIQTLQDTEQGTARYGVTPFADLTTQEFKERHLGLNHNVKDRRKMKLKKAVIPNIQLPPEFDWRHYNVVTPVKNQGACGSCWAFSVTGNVEGQWALRRGTLLSLSEQELVDCDKLDNGCNGGLPINAYEAIQKLGGLETESDYPYDGQDEKCHFDKSEVKATVVGGLNITSNETQMAQWLFYFGGVSHPWKMLCDPDNLDHGVLIVGYGVHTTSIRHRKMPYWLIKNSWGPGWAYPIFNKTLPYWTIKNSWGPSWGEQGYYRVYRGDGTCGVNQMATSAIIG